MFTDITGKRRYKVGLHCHSTRSDGHKTPEQVMAAYAASGYDVLALTDHWRWNDNSVYTYQKPDGTPGQMRILSGAEYNVGGSDASDGVYHILGIGCTRNPGLSAAFQNDPTTTPLEKALHITQCIRAAGGIAVLAHPAWSLNTPEQIRVLGPMDATEIYNSVSECHMSDRPYSGVIIDQMATEANYLPLLATDDSHYYDGDQCRGMIMVDADVADEVGILQAIRQNQFYATMGPEIHLERLDDQTVCVRCSSAIKVAFLSNIVWTDGRMVRGQDLTYATYTRKPGERYIRAEILTKEGLSAWSNILVYDKDSQL